MNNSIDGKIELIFSGNSGRTIAEKVYHEGNMRVSSNVELSNEKTPMYFLIGTGGGLIEGEKYQIDIDAMQGTHAILKTQTPTYVYKCLNGKHTEQIINLNLKDSFIEYITDEVIPYANAIYSQTTTINMDKNSTLIYSDGITSGWAPNEKSFLFTKVKQKTQIFMDDKLIFNDILLLDPQNQPINETGYFEGKENYNSLVIIDSRIDKAFIDKLQLELTDKYSKIKHGVSLLNIPGMVLRTLSQTAYENKKLIFFVINYFRMNCHNYPEIEFLY
ncbi:TPA: urease accessory protein UreD [Enterococcus hirae]